jgi:hypothetical protein
MKTLCIGSKMELDSSECQVFDLSNVIIVATFGIPKYVIIFKEADYPIGVFSYVKVNQR